MRVRARVGLDGQLDLALHGAAPPRPGSRNQPAPTAASMPAPRQLASSVLETRTGRPGGVGHDLAHQRRARAAADGQELARPARRSRPRWRRSPWRSRGRRPRAWRASSGPRSWPVPRPDDGAARVGIPERRHAARPVGQQQHAVGARRHGGGLGLQPLGRCRDRSPDRCRTGRRTLQSARNAPVRRQSSKM